MSIYTHNIGTGEQHKITLEKGINSSPAWSPDGTKLAVVLSFETNPDIYVIDIATGTRKRLTTDPAIDTEPSWSPDGQSIVFTSDRGGSPQIYKVSAAGGPAQRLTFEGRQNLRPVYSPDGKYIALVNVDGSSYRIGLLDVQTNQLRLISNGPLDESPSFAPNSAVVIYTAEGSRGSELETITVSGEVRQTLHQVGSEVREPAWSPYVP
jgi:TolB protein